MAKQSYKSQYAKESAYIRRRLKEIEARQPGSAIVQRYKGEFPGVKEIKGGNEAVYKAGLKAARELRKSGQLSVKAERRSISGAINTLQERGYNFINQDNARDLFTFLDDARARGLTSVYGYEKILETINRARKKGLSDEQIMANIDYWAENKEKGKRLTVRERKPKTDSGNISRRIRRK